VHKGLNTQRNTFYNNRVGSNILSVYNMVWELSNVFQLYLKFAVQVVSQNVQYMGADSGEREFLKIRLYNEVDMDQNSMMHIAYNVTVNPAL